jgi:glutamyl-tRNA synthetase
VGGARTALFNWLVARNTGGSFVLRVEDTDAARDTQESYLRLLDDLRWLGLDWDEGPDLGGSSAPYFQSQRLPLYEAALDRLKQRERVYPCTCTRADVARAASAPHAGDDGPTYPGTCAGRSAADAARLGDRPFAWRFRTPQSLVGWDDLALGRKELDPARLGGDFIVGRSGGGPSYQLAVVVDDALMGVNQVVRGDDLIPSTPRQILLYQALGWEPPTFGHVPLVIGPDGRRLAKRDQSVKLAALRDSGVDPRRLVGLLAQSCGWSSELVPSRPEAWIGRFDLSTIPDCPWMTPSHW